MPKSPPPYHAPIPRIPGLWRRDGLFFTLRQREPEKTALSEGALHADAAVMGFDSEFAEGQAEAAGHRFSDDGDGLDLIEFLENSLLILEGDARAIIENFAAQDFIAQR
jgi:hypothetical protein